jgi:hypothetical protein
MDEIALADAGFEGRFILEIKLGWGFNLCALHEPRTKIWRRFLYETDCSAGMCFAAPTPVRNRLWQ